jgi:hypothetical protein
VSITTTIAALQAVHAAVTDITSAPTTMPTNLTGGLLPIALVWPGPATWQLQAVGLSRQRREYEVRVYVTPVGQNKAGPETGYAACIALMEDIGQAYLDDVSLGGVVDQIIALTDEGVSGGLMWAETAYWGFVFRVSVVEKS